ncbi:MAG: maleylpyruvate isomerase family mycothiol-dependent enzyme [Aeromicrobium sp.]
MNVDEIWATTDEQRMSLCDLLEDLTPEQWEHPSLCGKWRVRDVAAHLSMAQATVREVLPHLVRGGFRFNTMIDRSARERAEIVTAAEIIAQIRGFAGSRRHPPGVTHIEPMLDIIVHGQDITRPLGIRRPIPVEPAAVAASRAWDKPFPWGSRKKFAGFELIADDVEWRRGSGKPVHGPISEILLTVTGRPAGRSALVGLTS